MLNADTFHVPAEAFVPRSVMLRNPPPVPVGTIELEAIRSYLESFAAGTADDMRRAEECVREILSDPRLDVLVKKARIEMSNRYVSIQFIEIGELQSVARLVRDAIKEELEERI